MPPFSMRGLLSISALNCVIASKKHFAHHGLDKVDKRLDSTSERFIKEIEFHFRVRSENDMTGSRFTTAIPQIDKSLA
ncbi:hypothetical protein CEXT_639791 [Caerostris extrusa]|uniref:Secreted protein n=1 Tax=Caerostris extrusa TaxID=172846 RepID=A0AAV4M2H7_CAEEX|nr:hypothetical protein CEXT_639791 [Caerostris extrusa]